MKLLSAAPKHLSDAIASLTILKYLMGLRVFAYPRGKPGIVLSLIYLLLLLGIFCVSVNVQRKFYKRIKLLKLEYVLYELMVYVRTSVVTYEMIFSWFHTKVSEYDDSSYNYVQVDREKLIEGCIGKLCS